MAFIKISDNMSVRIRDLENCLIAMHQLFVYLREGLKKSEDEYKIHIRTRIPQRLRVLGIGLLTEIKKEEIEFGILPRESATIEERYNNLINTGSEFISEIYTVRSKLYLL